MVGTHTYHPRWRDACADVWLPIRAGNGAEVIGDARVRCGTPRDLQAQDPAEQDCCMEGVLTGVRGCVGCPTQVAW